jgi:hypothetical protein
MADWDYRAYDANLTVLEGRETARNFPELALKLRQRGLQVLEATKLNKDGSLAAQRLAKMQARVESEYGSPEQRETPATSAIHKLLSWLIPPFLKRSND